MKNNQSSVFLLHPFVLVMLAFCTLFVACDETYTPKPKGYFRIDLPEKKYFHYQSESCPFEFDLPVYASMANYHDSLAQPCWKYIQFPKFNGEIFFTYKPVDNNIGNYLEESRALAYKHTVKADAIDETIVETPNKVYGMIYDIGGSAASSIQFYATDSVKHFVRGALYFNSPPAPDSLAPVIRFIREDVVKMMTSLRWEGK